MKILLADDHSDVRSALRLLLEQQPGLSVTGEAANMNDLLAQIFAAHPDLVLLDWELPDLPRSQVSSTLRSLYPPVKILALSGCPEARRPALAAGADAFICKSDPPETLLNTLARLIAA